ncbi:HEXXH motif domain-containing protein [Streptomyces sp. NPDC052023]|uniref:HEXXH motif domain-containing protein n=1 Tax=Streptomyces sp. NPDC052023 TaxID=3365681 RepID=UPI0037D498B3
MAADAMTAGDLPRFHRLSPAGALALSHGDGDGALVTELLGAERSRRLLLLRALDNALSRDDDPRVSYARAWALLERAQQRAPEAFEEVLMSPNTGMWVSLAVRRMRGRVYEEAPRWVAVGHLAALAAAAGTRAGLDFSITVPVRRGLVPLPTLGCAVLPDTEQWDTAEVTGSAGRLRVTGARGAVVEVAPGWDRRGPGWLPVRRLTLGSGPDAKSLVLEELDPYRTFPAPSEPRPLSTAEAAAWESMLDEAWTILLRDDPVSAAAMRHGLMSVAPTPTRERFRPHSSTAGDAFGGITASRPDDVPQLAATLVHEFQHTKLGGLMHLGPLTEQAPDPPTPAWLCYAPWRDDPRPLGGLLQGIYAFLGVTRFWRAHRHSADPAYAPLAHFEFAMWRTQVWSVLGEVRGHEQLTPLGRRVLDGLSERCAEWMGDEVPAAELRLAHEVAGDHLTRWRAHHLRPAAAAVDEAVRAWRRGAARPPAALAAEPDVVPDTEARHLDSAAVLARHRLSDPDGTWRHTLAGSVDGVEAPDVLLIRGDREAARAVYADRLTRKGAPVAAWAGLARALSGDPSHEAAATLLRGFPERARAVQDALVAATGRGADPVRLAAWLGQDQGLPGRPALRS